MRAIRPGKIEFSSRLSHFSQESRNSIVKLIQRPLKLKQVPSIVYSFPRKASKLQKCINFP
jgi:hypothetical protein